jgi:uncharacterized lipoprotein YajG
MISAKRVLSAVGAVAIVLVAGCNKQPTTQMDAEDHDPVADLPARFKTQVAVTKPNFADAAKVPEF